MVLLGFSRFHNGQLPGHSQVQHEMLASFKADNDPLAATLDGVNLLANQSGLPTRRPRLAERQVAYLDRGDAPASQLRAEVADDGFDFRQLGHVLLNALAGIGFLGG
jgi:hypothetical protein